MNTDEDKLLLDEVLSVYKEYKELKAIKDQLEEDRDLLEDVKDVIKEYESIKLMKGDLEKKMETDGLRDSKPSKKRELLSEVKEALKDYNNLKDVKERLDRRTQASRECAMRSYIKKKGDSYGRSKVGRPTKDKVFTEEEIAERKALKRKKDREYQRARYHRLKQQQQQDNKA